MTLEKWTVLLKYPGGKIVALDEILDSEQDARGRAVTWLHFYPGVTVLVAPVQIDLGRAVEVKA